MVIIKKVITWNYIILNKVLISNENTWKHTTTCKLFVLDWNTYFSDNVQTMIIDK